MPRLIDLGPGYGTVSFPDDATDEQIVAEYDALEAERGRALKEAKLVTARLADIAQENQPSLGKTLIAAGTMAREGAVGGVKQAVGNVARTVADIFAVPRATDPELGVNVLRQAGIDLADEGRQQRESARELVSGIGGGLPTAIAGSLGETAGISAPTLLAAPLGLPAAAVSAGLQSYGLTVDDFKSQLQARNPNLSEADAFRQAQIPAAIVGGITGVLTRTFGGVERLVERIAREGLRKEGVKGILYDATRSALLEFPEESLDQLAQGLIEKAAINPDKPVGQILNDAAMAGLAGAALGGVMGGGISTVANVAGGVADRIEAPSRMRRGEERRRAVISDAVNRGELLTQPTTGGQNVQDATQLAAQEAAIQPAEVQGIPPQAETQAPIAPPLRLQAPRVEAAIAPITAQWQSAPPVRVVQTYAELPAHVQADAVAAGLDNKIRGAMDRRNNTVWLVADGIESEEVARRTVLHESLGHFGVDALFDNNDDFTAFMRGVAARHAATELGNQVRRDYGEDEILVGREVIAKLAENPQQDPTLWQQIVGAVRQFARRFFNLEVSDNDIRILLSRAGQRLRSGSAIPSGVGAVSGSQFAGQPNRIPIQIRQADGTVVDGEFTGYYDLREFGKGTVPSVGWRLPNGNMTHTLLAEGQQIVGDVPTFEQWQAQRQRSQFASTDVIPYGFWVSPSGEMIPIRFSYEHDQKAKEILGADYRQESGAANHQLEKLGYVRAVFDRNERTLHLDAFYPVSDSSKRSVRDFAIENQIGAVIDHFSGGRKEYLHDPRSSSFSVTDQPAFFRNRQQVEAARQDPALTPAQTTFIREMAEVQSSMVDDEIMGWLIAQPKDEAERKAQERLSYLQDRRFMGDYQRWLNSLPETTEEEKRAKEVAGALILGHYGMDRATEKSLTNEIESDEPLLKAAVGKISKLNQAQLKANFLEAMFKNLTTDYRTYLANKAATAPASDNLQAQWRENLNRAQERLNDQQQSPVAVERALSAIAANIPDTLLLGGTNQAIIDWVLQNGILQGVVSDAVRDWMLVNDGTGTPAMIGYTRLVKDLTVLRDILTKQQQVAADIDAFEKWFRPSGKPGTVPLLNFAQRYAKFRYGRDRALAIVAATEKEIGDIDTRIRANTMARDRLQSMMTRPAYVNTVRGAADKADVVVRALYESPNIQTGLINRGGSRTEGFWKIKGPITGKEYLVDLNPTSAQEDENITNLSEFVSEARTWAADNIDNDPLLSDEYNNLADYVERNLMHPSLNPRNGFTQLPWVRIPGTQIRISPDPFEWITSGTSTIGVSTHTLRDVVERIGGRPVRMLAKDAEELDRVMRKVEAVNNHPEFGFARQTAVILQALASHGWTAEHAARWDEEVAEPVLAAAQNKLSSNYEVGDTIVGSGVKVTQEDLNALKLMKAWGDALLVAAPNHIQEKLGDLGVSRKAIGNGRFTGHRIAAPWVPGFISDWSKLSTDAQKMAMLNRDPLFRRVIMGYMGEFNPEFNLMNASAKDRSPLYMMYRRLAKTEKEGVQSFHSLDEVLNFLANEMVSAGVSPDFATARDTAQKTLLKEVSGFIKSFTSGVLDSKPEQVWGGVPEAVVAVASANNPFTKARGRLLAPSTFYTYSTASEGRRLNHVGNLRSLMILKVLQSGHEAVAALEAKKLKMEERLNELVRSGATKKEARREVLAETSTARAAGDIRFDYNEILVAIESLRQAIGHMERFEASTPDSHQHQGVAAWNNVFGVVKSSLLSSMQAMSTNYWSGALLGPAIMHWQTGQHLKAVRDIAPVFMGGTGLITKTLMKRVAAAVAGNPIMSKLLQQHAPMWNWMAGKIVDSAKDWQRIQQIAQQSGMVNKYNIRDVLANKAELKPTGGRLEANPEPHAIAEMVNSILSAPGIRHATEGLKATFPRVLDNLINYSMVLAWDHETDFLKKVGWNAFKNREAAAGSTDWKDLSNPANVLQPEDLGLRSHKALERYQQLFVPLGSLDAVLLDFYERTKSMTPEQREAEPLIPDPDDHAGLALQYAAVSNVATESNRPFSLKGKGSDGVWRNIVGTFMGWVVNMMKQFSKALQTHSGDKQFSRIAQNFFGLVTIISLLAAVGAWNWEFGDELSKLVYGQSSARIQPGNIEDWQTGALYALQALVNTVPIIGQQIGSWFGVPFTGRGSWFDMSSLSPQIGFAAGVVNTTKRIIQTGDATLPLIDFTKQWLPFSKILINRLPLQRGLLAQQNAIRSMNGSAPPGTEIKWGQRGGGEVRYGPANDEIQRLIASAYEVSLYGGSQEELLQRYNDAIEAYVRAGRSPDDAVKAVATALAAKEPVRVLTGREMTPEEEARWVKRMTPDQKKDYQNAQAAWAMLSMATGKDFNMVSTGRSGGGGGGGGSIMGIRSVMPTGVSMNRLPSPASVMPQPFRPGSSVTGRSIIRSRRPRLARGRRRGVLRTRPLRSPRVRTRRVASVRRRRYASV